MKIVEPGLFRILFPLLLGRRRAGEEALSIKDEHKKKCVPYGALSCFIVPYCAKYRALLCQYGGLNRIFTGVGPVCLILQQEIFAVRPGVVLSLIAELRMDAIMPQLIVRQIEEKVVQKLKARAGQHGVSMEEEHRRILREALAGPSMKRPSFKEYLMQMPDVGPDEWFERSQDFGREVEL